MRIVVQSQVSRLHFSFSLDLMEPFKQSPCIKKLEAFSDDSLPLGSGSYVFVLFVSFVVVTHFCKHKLRSAWT